MGVESAQLEDPLVLDVLEVLTLLAPAHSSRDVSCFDKRTGCCVIKVNESELKGGLGLANIIRTTQPEVV